MGGPSGPSVSRSPGVTLQEKAGRHMGPSTLRCEFPWEVVVVFVGFLFFGSSGFCLFVVKLLLFLGGRCMFSGPLSPSRPDPCLVFICLSSFFSCMVCSSTPCVLFLSLRRWGTPNLFGLGSPCVSSTWTRSSPSTRTSSSSPTPRHCPAFFFFRRRRSFAVRSVGVGFPGGCFFCLWSLFFLCAMHCMTDLGTCKGGRETRHLPPR